MALEAVWGLWRDQKRGAVGLRTHSLTNMFLLKSFIAQISQKQVLLAAGKNQERTRHPTMIQLL